MEGKKPLRYNPDIKLMFEKDSEYSKAVKIVFDKAIVFENKFNKDLYNFTKGEILEYLNSFFLANPIVLAGFVKLIQLYCYTRHRNSDMGVYTGSWVQLTFKDLKQITDTKKWNGKSCVTKQDVEELCSIFPNPQDQFILRAVHEGFFGDGWNELWNATVSQIDEANKTIKLCSGREINISQELIETAKAADQTEYYISVTPKPINEEDLIDCARINWRSVFMKDEGYICKVLRERRKEKEFTGNIAIQHWAKRTRDFTGFDNGFKIDAIRNGGFIEALNAGCKKYNRTAKQFVENKFLVEPVETQYDKHPFYFRFLQNYEEFFVQ